MNRECVLSWWKNIAMQERVPADWSDLRKFFSEQVKQCFLESTHLSDSVIEFVLIPYLQHSAGECVCSTIYCAGSVQTPRNANLSYIPAELQLQVWGQDHEGYCSGLNGECNKIEPYTLCTNAFLQMEQWMTYVWCQAFDKQVCSRVKQKCTHVDKWFKQFQLDCYYCTSDDGSGYCENMHWHAVPISIQPNLEQFVTKAVGCVIHLPILLDLTVTPVEQFKRTASATS